MLLAALRGWWVRRDPRTNLEALRAYRRRAQETCAAAAFALCQAVKTVTHTLFIAVIDMKASAGMLSSSHSTKAIAADNVAIQGLRTKFLNMLRALGPATKAKGSTAAGKKTASDMRVTRTAFRLFIEEVSYRTRTRAALVDVSCSYTVIAAAPHVVPCGTPDPGDEARAADCYRCVPRLCHYQVHRVRVRDVPST